MTPHVRRAHATPTPTLFARRLAWQTSTSLKDALAAASGGAITLFGERIPSLLAGLYGPRGLRLLLNLACVLLVLSLPLTAAGAAAKPSALPETTTLAVAQIASTDVGAPRASTTARGVSAGSRDPSTAIAPEARAISTYAVAKGDTLSSIANAHDISIDTLAYANGIETEDELLHAGQELVIPPAEGAVYTIQDGDTLDSVATKFEVKVDVLISAYNLINEPQNFAPGKQIFIPGGNVPAIKRSETPRQIAVPLTPQQLPPMNGRLQWPVNGVITQYFWWGHTGVDIAAPYGTPIVSSLDGVVVATGWVAVGGLRVCVQGGDGFKVCDYHTSAIYVSVGQQVQRGQTIAAIGLTGVTTGPHVHWEVWLNGAQVNGLQY
ncbi:MAG TPA: M23 family metallopeptidase [Candidatus Limnocylindria bacterium]